MEECLKKSADGRKYAVALGSLEYSGDLSKELVTFSSKLETVFQKMQELRSQGNKDERVYSKFFQILDDKFSWYQKAEARPRSCTVNRQNLNLKSLTVVSTWLLSSLPQMPTWFNILWVENIAPPFMVETSKV